MFRPSPNGLSWMRTIWTKTAPYLFAYHMTPRPSTPIHYTLWITWIT